MVQTCSALLVALLLSLALPAHAQEEEECEPPGGEGPLEVTPASSATGVSLGAVVRVLFTEDYFATQMRQMSAGTLVRLLDQSGAPVPGTSGIIGDYLFFTPDELLAPRMPYTGVAVGADFDLEFNFATGSAVDTQPPRFGEISEVGTAEVDQSCDAPEGGYRVDVSFPPATDDGPPGDIEYLLYVTRGPEVIAPTLEARVRNYATDLIPMAFVISPAEAVSPICIAVHAIDGVGNVDDDGREHCFEPIQGNFFEPICAIGPVRRSPPLWLAIALGALYFRRRRR